MLLNEQHKKYYPHTYVGKDRYMGIKMQLSQSRTHNFKNMNGLLFPPKPTEFKGYYHKNVEVDTLDKLLKWAKEPVLNI